MLSSTGAAEAPVAMRQHSSRSVSRLRISSLLCGVSAHPIGSPSAEDRNCEAAHQRATVWLTAEFMEQQPLQDSQAQHAAQAPGAYDVPEDTVSLIDLLAVLARRWRLIFFGTFAAGLFMVLFSLYTISAPADGWNPLPNVYEPRVEVLLREGSSGSGGVANLLGGSDSSGLAALAGIAIGQEASDAALAEELVYGNFIVDTIVQEFNIIERNGFTETPRTSSREFVRESLTVEYSPDTRVMSIGFEHTDPEFATEIINRIVVLLESRFRELTQENVADQQRFFNSRLADAETELRAASQRLLDFQQQYGLLDVESAAQQNAEVLTVLTTELINRQLELQNLLTYLPADAPVVRQTEEEIRLREEAIQRLRVSRSGELTEFSQAEIAGLTARQAELELDLQVQTSVYTSLRTQIETLQLEQADDRRNFQVLQTAEVPEVKSGPSRSVITVVVTFAVFFLSVFLAFILDYVDRVREDPIEGRKLAEIRRVLPHFRRQTD